MFTNAGKKNEKVAFFKVMKYVHLYSVYTASMQTFWVAVCCVEIVFRFHRLISLKY